MRNWNAVMMMILFWYILLSDYLWGIETINGKWQKVDYPVGFQTTYEELKQAQRKKDRTGSRSFQTTYEELKHAFLRPEDVCVPVRLSDYLWGIETFETNHQHNEQSLLSDYLWGIETYSVAHPMQGSLGLSDYLWGIETCIQYIYRMGKFELSDYLWGIETPDGWQENSCRF